MNKLGYDVIQAAKPQEALNIVETGRSIDVLFTDMVMPEMNGRELARRMLLLEPRLKVLFTTGYAGDLSVRDGELTPILQKPFSIDQLGRRLRELLDR